MLIIMMMVLMLMLMIMAIVTITMINPYGYLLGLVSTCLQPARIPTTCQIMAIPSLLT